MGRFISDRNQVLQVLSLGLDLEIEVFSLFQTVNLNAEVVQEGLLIYSLRKRYYEEVLKLLLASKFFNGVG